MSDTTPERFPGWPAWLTPEYSALHTRIENAIKRGTASVHASSDSAGMDWTSGGMLSCQASAILNDLCNDGWVPPKQAMTPVEPLPAPVDYQVPDRWVCEKCDEDTYELIEVEQVDESTLNVCESCRDDLVAAFVVQLRERHSASVEYARVSAWSVSRGGEYEGEVYRFDDGTEYRGGLWGVR